jgi:hypothetical protein
MRLRYLASVVIVLSLTSSATSLWAQHGGKGGGTRGGAGGMQHGNSEHGNSEHRGSEPHGGSGGFGGGLSGSSSEVHRSTSVNGPYGHESSGAKGSTASGRTASAEARPGAGASGAGGPVSGVGVRPGLGAGAAGGPASGVGVRPGAGAGAAGVPAAENAAHAYGTHYTSEAALASQGAAYRDAAVDHRPYTPATFNEYPKAWPPTNVIGTSLYTHPGYGNLATGLGLAAQPVPYDYGSNVVFQTNTVYVNGDAVGAPQEYANQARQIASAGRSAQPAQDTKWLPLGVFAVAEGDQTQSDDIFQLAVDQQGIIRGNYHNKATDQMETISGSVDTKTQRAAWTIGSDETPVYEAGVANLTKDQTTILVHTGDGQSRQVSLIRLPQPPQ